VVAQVILVYNFGYVVTQVTDGVKVSVETFYQPEYSRPAVNEYMFAYRIRIENRSLHTVKLLSRHWFITDSASAGREVEGAGVVGKQPVIEPGASHTYVSGCQLNSEIGRMSGTYTMQRVMDGKEITVNIPAFDLVAPFKMN
jgi:ApaG protein